jgi:UDP-N-acetylglucosamine--N-acetylmuramyl-(pentapeptide) pyrophosphoryl-undecaprenol N-acetylglucosamine transferase
MNASALVKAGAALLVDDRALTADWLKAEVIPLLTDQARLEHMAGKAKELGIRNADQQMADLVLEAVTE